MNNLANELALNDIENIKPIGATTDAQQEVVMEDFFATSLEDLNNFEFCPSLHTKTNIENNTSNCPI